MRNDTHVANLHKQVAKNIIKVDEVKKSSALKLLYVLSAGLKKHHIYEGSQSAVLLQRKKSHSAHAVA